MSRLKLRSSSSFSGSHEGVNNQGLVQCLHETYDSAVACQERTIHAAGLNAPEQVEVGKIATLSVFVRLHSALVEGARQSRNGMFMFYLGLAQIATMFILSLVSSGLIGPVSYVVGSLLVFIGVVRITLHSVRFWPYSYRHFEIIR